MSCYLCLFHKAKKKFVWLSFTARPLLLKTGKKFLLLQKYTAPYFQYFKKSFFFFENFYLLKIFFKLVLSTCLHFNTGLKHCVKVFLLKLTYLHLILGDIAAIIPCSLLI